MAMELKHLNPQHVMDVTGKAIDEISRLRAENAELKAKLESEKESRYADSEGGKMKEYYFGRKRWYDADEVDKILAELRENHKKAIEMDTENWNRLCVKYNKLIEMDTENWNRLCVKYNKLIELKKEFCEKFKDIELEIDK